MVFSIRYGIPMKGPGCARSVTRELESLDGVESVNVNLDTQEAVITGEVAPSKVVARMQGVGRDAFVRGSGQPNSAAVAILETTEGQIKGLTRLIEVSPSRTLFDVTVDGAHANSSVDLYEFGDMSAPPKSLGAKLFNIVRLPFAQPQQSSVSAYSVVSDTPLAGLIGRAVHTSSGLSGVVARSAGLWENDKEVCACSGKTVWEERKDFREHTNGHL